MKKIISSWFIFNLFYEQIQKMTNITGDIILFFFLRK